MARRTIAGSRGIVTGASSGIGRAIAVELARNGAKVLAVARRAERLSQLCQESFSHGGSITSSCGDISDPTVRAAILAQAKDKLGGIDFLVNAAGISSVARFVDSTPERLRQILEVNFFAPVELIRIALPELTRGVNPIVVNIGSILGHRAIPWHADYCASKFALRGLSESIRPELAKQGIDLLMVSPGTTKTELYATDTTRQKLPWRQPRGVLPEYVARQTVQAMARGKREIIPNPQGRLLVWLSRFFPSILDRAMNKYG